MTLHDGQTRNFYVGDDFSRLANKKLWACLEKI